MKTFFDFLSVGLFIVLAVLYLHRSSRPEPDGVSLWKYAAAAGGCAVGNLLGNAGQALASFALLAGVAVFVVHLLLISLPRR